MRPRRNGRRDGQLTACFAYTSWNYEVFRSTRCWQLLRDRHPYPGVSSRATPKLHRLIDFAVVKAIGAPMLSLRMVQNHIDNPEVELMTVL
jgi:hypothetical protein